ncbi:HNH endonuclease [Lysinibacillus sphaericus]|uniref:Putative HNH nuclease YajD n=1 Tax=Lysinibacillus sphaericus OT4b.31 TaxID=1285586 RepID=R7Z925_LYSSH|nr:HNH endonuclease [Lysinibacillus sphaericus OT4b.31]
MVVIYYKNDNHAFYNSKEWISQRKKILKRDKYICQICRRFGRNKSAEVIHHIIELNENWSKRLDENNLILLCHRCHNGIHKAEKFIWKNKYLVLKFYTEHLFCYTFVNISRRSV